MSESKKIQITVQEDRSEAKAICAVNRSVPATIQPEPLDLTGEGFQDFGSVRALLNTILEYENVPERIIPILGYFHSCDVLGDVEKLQALAAKYDMRNAYSI